MRRPFFLLVFFLLSVFCQEEIVDLVFPAFEDCPCVDPWVTLNLSDCIPTSDPNFCAPLNYGASKCDLWDKFVNPVCQQEDPPDYCPHAFCYIDTRNCNRPHASSVSFNFSALLPDDLDSPFYEYSYGTCGYQDRFGSNDLIVERLKGATLRVSFPLPSSVSTFFSYYDSEKEEYAGAVHSFMDDVFEALQINILPVPLSNQSLSRFPSTSFTSCVHDVSINNTDLCVSDFWITPQRRLMTTFTEQLEQDLFYLYIVGEEDEDWSFGEILANPFAPFHYSVWLLIIVFLFVTGFLYLAFERKNYDDFVESDSIWSKLYHTTYLSFQSFGSASVVQVPKRKSTKMMLIGFGFFILVMVASYTAELASFFIQESQKTTISGLEEGLDRGYRICGYVAVEEYFLELYPRAASSFVGLGAGGDILQTLNDGGCEMIMLAIEDWEASQSLSFENVNDGFVCSLRRVGEPLFTVGIAVPISPEYEPVVSYIITRLKSRFLGYREEATEDFLVGGSCEGVNVQEENPELDLSDLGGVFFIAAIFYSIAIIFHWTVDKVVKEKVDPDEQENMKQAVLAALREFHAEK